MKERHLHLTSEEDTTRQQILIVSKEIDRYVSMLKTKLESYDNEVVILDDIPGKLTPYYACFFLNITERKVRDIIGRHKSRFIFLYINQSETAKKCVHLLQNYHGNLIKVINLETSLEFFTKDLEALFWFSFTSSDEKYLPISHHQLHTPKQAAIHHVKHRKKKLTGIEFWNHMLQPKFVVTAIILLVIFFHGLFTPLLAISTYWHYRAGQEFRANEIEKAEATLVQAKNMLGVSKVLYSWVRPTFSLFSLAIFPDDMFLANQAAASVIENGIYIQKRSTEMRELFYRTDKTESETIYTSQLMENILERVSTINQNIGVLKEKLPPWNKQLKDARLQLHEVNQYIGLAQPFFPYVDWLAAKNTERRYLILFANNMELRPGGGFIGSFAVVTIKNYALADFKVYDVYDADGQLTAHVKPPEPIEEYLEQPHWYLRDSAFAPDFTENAQQAQFFLEKSMGMKDFDGVILVTTTAIQHILQAMDKLYIPDFKETVTADNFYLKAQLYAEKDFFPGSSQKKSFLGAVMNQMIISLYDASPVELFKAARRSLDEKQMVVYFRNRELQKLIDSRYWSGRTITLNCNVSPNPNCLVDYIFPLDANLGVNKANFFISKTHDMKVKIDADGTIHNTLTVNYTNDSYKQVFPGGTYKNYFQVLLPKDIKIIRVVNQGKTLDSYDLQSKDYTKIGFLTQIPPQKSGSVVIEYELLKKIQKGSGIYQLILQKQIGSPNGDFGISIELPKNLYVVNKNFSPVVKGNTIHYNTSLSADKIFFIEFFTE